MSGPEWRTVRQGDLVAWIVAGERHSLFINEDDGTAVRRPVRETGIKLPVSLVQRAVALGDPAFQKTFDFATGTKRHAG